MCNEISIKANLLRAMFKDVYFINGTAYAGKSTMVHLLAEKHDGIECGENYHAQLTQLIDPEHQPNLSYISGMHDWQQFVTRTPREYAGWIAGCSREASELEILLLIRATASGRKVFVDTNIYPDLLRLISDDRHVLFMLAPQDTSVHRFFDREDSDKQFLYQVLMQCPNREWAFANYRECLRAINSDENRRSFEESGFKCLHRDESRSIEDTLAIVERHFGLA